MTIPGATPTTNTDSLFIGVSGASTPFQGQLDEIRIWDKALTSANNDDFFRISLTENRNAYSGLVMSITFQDENSSGSDFNTRDMTGTGNNGFARNVTPVDRSNQPYATIHPNLSAVFNGTSYLSSVLDASSAITLECWIFPSSTSPATFISKGSTASPAYFLGWNGTKLSQK